MAEVAETYEDTLATGAESEKAVLDAQIAEEKAASEAGVRRLEEARKLREPEWERYKQKQAEVEAIQPPRLMKPPPPPNTQEMTRPTSLQKTMGMASIFALLSVGLAKDSAIYGLKAMGGFLEGAHAGNLEQADAALKDYNNNMRYVHDTNEYALQEYNAIFNNKKFTLQQQENAFKQKALEFNDTLALEEYRQKGMTGTHALLRERAKVDLAFAKELKRSQEWQVRTELMKQRAAATGGAGSTAASIFGIPMTSIPQAEPGEKNEAFLKMLPPVQADLVRRIAKGDIATSGFGNMAVKDRNEYIKAASTYDPGFNTRLYGILDKAGKEATPGGKIGLNELAINTLAHHIDDYAEQFKRLDNSQVQRWNSAKNKLRTEFGDPALQRLKVPAGLAAAEIARIVKGGTAAPTEDEIKYWEGVFNTSASPAQTNAVIWQALQGVGGRLATIEEAYKRLGAPRRVLSDESVELLLKHKPKNVPTPSWLKRERQAAGDLSDLEKQAELSPERKEEIRNQVRSRVDSALPRAVNPQTGEVMVFKGGKWQKE